MEKVLSMYAAVKRVLDVVFALTCLIVLSPIFAVISIAIVLDSGLPVLFKQRRIGINKTAFQILKFRTMYMDTPEDTPTHQLKNPEQYITRVGRFLRRTSLDELPQILNILAGDMSFVGPRPALWNQDDLIAERDKYGANQVRPGLTGWAQINGRDKLPIEVKARLDGEYVRRMGFWMDVKCMLGTVLTVITTDGVVEGGTGAGSERSNEGGPSPCEESSHYWEGQLHRRQCCAVARQVPR
jgi:O-antigen biosynthesis protein WbqP